MTTRRKAPDAATGRTLSLIAYYRTRYPDNFALQHGALFGLLTLGLNLDVDPGKPEHNAEWQARKQMVDTQLLAKRLDELSGLMAQALLS